MEYWSNGVLQEYPTPLTFFLIAPSLQMNGFVEEKFAFARFEVEMKEFCHASC